MVMTVITSVMRMIASVHQRSVIMAVSMPIITFPSFLVVHDSKGSCPVGLRQPPGRDQRAHQHEQRNPNGQPPLNRPPDGYVR